MRVQLLLTGNELMSGDTIDSNSAMIAQSLAKIGLSIYAKTTIGDDLQQLIDNIRQSARESDLLIVNGGLGPTVDDLTAQALALAVNCELKENAQAMEHLNIWCEQRGLALNAANRKQALLPSLASIVPNERGSAVGFQLCWENCLIICTPGVPSELRQMLSDQIMPTIKSSFTGYQKKLIERYQVFGIGESGLQQLIMDQLPDWPDCLELGFRAGAPLLEVKIATNDTTDGDIIKIWTNKLLDLLGAHLVGKDNCQLNACVVSLLKERSLTVTTAESCTGGLIASMLTEVPGASTVFNAGFVTYSNAAKRNLLNVQQASLVDFGAVSESVVREMAVGALNKSDADYVIAVSGIAGPDGGTEEKPVGTVWIAFGSKAALKTAHVWLPYGRKLFQTMVAAMGLDLVRRELLQITESPRYLAKRSFRK